MKERQMYIHTTPRGYQKAKFLDALGRSSSIEETNELGEKSTIWLGLDNGDRIRLDADTAKLAASILIQFAETGKIAA
ncbi:hypothetical protein CH379_018420 [Leptospira ellisii]|uniref:Uncharacterized protein n=1 Tax=Leptospira ellisii TaxID=2023197 RepID=A0A2N0BGN5_9LEPT|nr:hypothetical protein [Leptospira ellisii]MDV6237612.1 hypothetical protein [Leptospira ellisii]PJZ91689.1 hypothetical protein CH379_17285 [Leptospira ellisii]PKA03162.1 hypothetical protein CH375_18655 [Leptospira ellisii]